MSDPGPAWLVGQVARSQELLDASLGSLTEQRIREPSALPGWTRGHVLAHIAGNGRTAAEMFEGYARGEQVPQYRGSQGRREAEIEADACLPTVALVELVRDTGARCLAAYRAMPEWGGTLRWLGGRFPVTRGPISRWREIEIHRVDLALGYLPADWPADFVEFYLSRELARLPERAPTVTAPDLPPTELLGWLFGRDGTGLPPLPAWG